MGLKSLKCLPRTFSTIAPSTYRFSSVQGYYTGVLRHSRSYGPFLDDLNLQPTRAQRLKAIDFCAVGSYEIYN